MTGATRSVLSPDALARLSGERHDLAGPVTGRLYLSGLNDTYGFLRAWDADFLR